MLLLDEFESLVQVKSRDDLLAATVEFAQRLGFEKVGMFAVADHAQGEPEFACVNNTPAGYWRESTDPDNGRRDPVMQHCKRSGVPIAWNHATYSAASEAAMWERQASFGYCTGIAYALHLPGGMHFFVGVDRDQSLPACRAEVRRLVAELQLFTVHAQESAFRVLLPPSPEPDMPDLTARELECLRWTMEGKTAWELGRILGISEQTAVRHVNNGTHKLDAVNKHHAVVKALRLGLIR